MSVDKREYATGDNPNPLDEPAQIPRKDDWQGKMLADRTKQTESQPWYPVAHAPPDTVVPPRYRAFEVDKGHFQASISPQKWDCTSTIAVPVNDNTQGPPIEVVPFLPGRAHLEITCNGNNPIIVSPGQEEALNGRGVVIPKGTSKSFDTQAGFWAWAIGGASTVVAWWTAYESPTSHLPPRDKD